MMHVSFILSLVRSFVRSVINYIRYFIFNLFQSTLIHLRDCVCASECQVALAREGERDVVINLCLLRKIPLSNPPILHSLNVKIIFNRI